MFFSSMIRMFYMEQFKIGVKEIPMNIFDFFTAIKEPYSQTVALVCKNTP